MDHVCEKLLLQLHSWLAWIVAVTHE